MRFTLLWYPIFTVSAFSGTSANYTLSPDVIDGGGLRGTSANYTSDFSGMAGGAGSSAGYVNRTGYAGQLGDVVATAIELSAPQLTVNETSTLQISAEVVYDDLTTAVLDATDVTWSVTSGPITGIDVNGLATAGTVYQDTAAVVQGDYQTFSDTLGLTVMNTLPDNFGSYASDGIDDDWQVLYFGLDNPLAAPTQDPDFDGQNNLFEFLAKVTPNDSASFFEIVAKAVPGQPGQKEIVFDPRYVDRTYVVQTSTLLTAPSWSTLTPSSVSDNGTERTVNDPNATGPRKFYRVLISK